ncbi:MAG: hypothetical protein IPJ13_24090 [Saprospiraceae bacterium]|nr:hypothetical protein [Saprospiraceae bacterium]
MVEINGKWERVVITNSTKIIKRYRPRIEGLFSRIEKFEDSGNVFWKVTSKENVVSVYGESHSARIANPVDANQIFSWNLEYTYDDKGNFIRYIYKQEDNTNLLVSVSEKTELMVLHQHQYLPKISIVRE